MLMRSTDDSGNSARRRAIAWQTDRQDLPICQRLPQHSAACGQILDALFVCLLFARRARLDPFLALGVSSAHLSTASAVKTCAPARSGVPAGNVHFFA